MGGHSVKRGGPTVKALTPSWVIGLRTFKVSIRPPPPTSLLRVKTRWDSTGLVTRRDIIPASLERRAPRRPFAAQMFSLAPKRDPFRGAQGDCNFAGAPVETLELKT